MFGKLDPRIRLLWWFAITTITLSLKTTTSILVIVFFLFLSWQLTGLSSRFTQFTLRMIPMLVFITLVSLFPTFELTRGIKMSLRYYIMLASTSLIMQTTNYAELTNALRNLRHPRLSFLEKPLEVFSFIFGLAFLTVPLTAEEWNSLRETQKMRGVDPSAGSKLRQVKNGLASFLPLLLRLLERIKHFSLAVIMYGYNPLVPRSLFTPLTLSPIDKRFAILFTIITIAGIIIAFAFKV